MLLPRLRRLPLTSRAASDLLAAASLRTSAACDLRSLAAPAARLLCAPAAPAGLRSFSSAADANPLPTLEEVRRLSPAELEVARVQLSKALECAEQGLAEAYSDETARQRTSVSRVLATTLVRLGAPLDAETVLNQALTIDPSHGPMARRIAISNGAHGATADELVELNFLLGVCYQKSGREEQALEVFEDVLEQTDGEHWRARFHMALLSIGQGWHDQGEALLRGVLERNPDHADSQDILAKLVERRQAERNELRPPENE